MHSQPRNWTRNAILVLAPLTLIALLAVFVVPSLVGSGSGSGTKLAAADFDAVSPTTTSTTAVSTTTASPEAAESTGDPEDLGVVTGTYLLKGPSEVTEGAMVLFVVDGKKQLVVTDKKAPYALHLRTRSLPNGTYTVNVITSASGTTATVATYQLTVKNVEKTTTTSAPSSTTETSTTTSASGGGKSDSSGSGSSGSSTADTYAAKVLAITNEEREAVGCDALTMNAKLTQAAQGHSEDMAENDYFDHTGLDGSSPFDRMADAGYDFSAAAENIAMGQQTPAAVMKAWMNSEGHRENILNCTYTEMGLGYAVGDGSPYWTQTFGNPL